MELENKLNNILNILKNSRYMELKTIAQEAELFEATRVFKSPSILRKVKEVEGTGKKVFQLDYEVFQVRQIEDQVIIERLKKYQGVSSPDVITALVMDKGKDGNFVGGKVKTFDEGGGEFSFKVDKAGEIKNYRPVKADKSKN